MKKFDFLLFGVTTLPTVVGLLRIFDPSSFISFGDFGTKYHYIQDQAVWMVLGFGVMTFFAFFDYKRLYQLALPLLVAAIAMLLLVFLPGIGVKVLGAHRWLNLHFFILQPAEFVKLSLAIYLAAWFANKEKGRFTAFLLLSGLVVFLVMLEPDMGTTIIILSELLLVYFLSGGNIMYFLGLLPILAVGGLLLVKLSPYRASRLATFLNVNQSAQGASYHVRQILIALGSGGFAGLGLGNSLQKFAYLPENTTDSIFAIIAEELGFIGAFVVILLFAFLIWRILTIATLSKDPFGKLLAGGIAAFLGMQIIINLGAQTALFPLTGVPLPFISYGGFALLAAMSGIGIVLNIARKSL